MTKRATKKATSPRPVKPDYKFLGFRPSPLIDRRLRALSERSGQSISALVRDCVAAQIGVMEKAGRPLEQEAA